MNRWIQVGILFAVICCAAHGFEPAAATPGARDDAAISPSAARRIQALFRPFQTDAAALSPSGQYVAYSLREGSSLSVIVVDAEKQERILTKVEVERGDSAAVMLGDEEEETLAEIGWMEWVNDRRLIVGTNRRGSYVGARPGSWITRTGVVLAVDVDAKKVETLLTPNDVAENVCKNPSLPNHGMAAPNEDPGLGGYIRTNLPPEPSLTDRWPRSLEIAGFFPGDPESVLVVAYGRNGYGRYALHALSGGLKPIEEEILDPTLIPIADRSRHARAVLSGSFRTPFPHAFMIEGGRRLHRWTKLDDMIRESTGGGFSVSPENFFGHRAVPLGFAENPDVLYYASNVGREVFGIYSVNLKTRKREALIVEHPTFDLIRPAADGLAAPGTLVFDRYTNVLTGVRFQAGRESTLWLRADLAALQRRLETVWPERSVRILGWDRAERKFLVLSFGPTECGSFSLVDIRTGRTSEFALRAPWLSTEAASTLQHFRFSSAQGTPMEGTLVVPRCTRLTPAPVLVWLRADAWEQTPASFEPELEAFASLGLVVLQVNGRGTWGFGVSRRELPPEGLVRACLDDVLRAIEGAGRVVPLNEKRVVIAGAKRGGYLGLRAAQLRPDRFRCVVALEPLLDPRTWAAESARMGLDGDLRLQRMFWPVDSASACPAISEANPPLARPALLLINEGSRRAELPMAFLDARTLARRMETSGGLVTILAVGQDYVRRSPRARCAAFREIEAFINLHLYEYAVNVGETKPVRD